MKQAKYLFGVLAIALLVACQAIAPQNFQESLVATQTAITTVRQTGQQAALAGKLTKEQAQYVNDQADLGTAGVKAARSIKDPKEAQDQLGLTLTVLKAVQFYLVSKGATK